MNAYDIIMKRASYRGAYEPRPVPRVDLEKIMRAGLAAPSGCNKQTASLIAVDDPALLAALREVAGRMPGSDAPAAVCVLTQRIFAYRDKCFSAQDYAAAIENMLLTITELGYESCWVEGHITDKDRLGRKMADLLGVPQDYELVCYLPVGVAAEAIKRPEKKPFAERAWFNGFRKIEGK
jgi:nitroreductase